MDMMKMYAFPLTVVTLAVVYKIFKLPKQDVSLLRRILFRDNKPIVFGHRSGYFEAPENTCLAIETAWKNGATAVEIDLEFSKDGVPILFHDSDVDRVTNGSGKVRDFMYHDLQKLNAAASFNYTITKDGKEDVSFEKVPTLVEAVETCRKYNLIIDLDVKSNGRKTCECLKSLLKTYPDAPTFIIVTSFYPDIIYQIRKECPQYFTGLIWRYHYTSRTISGVPRFAWYITPFLDIVDKLSEMLIHSWLPDFLGISLVVMHKDHLSTRYIDAWRKRSVELITWTVNNPVEKDFILKKQGVPIVTDSLLNSEECQDQTT